MNKLVKLFVLLLSLTGLGLWGGNAFAATCTTNAGTGTWGTAATWTCNHVPVATDTVVITRNITLSSSSTIIGLTVHAGVTFSGNNRDLTVSGPVLISGTYNTGGGNLTTTNGGALTVNTGGTFDFNNGNASISGNVAINGTLTSGGDAIEMTGAGTTLSGTGAITNTDFEIGALGISLSAGSTLEFSTGAQLRVGNNNTASFTLNGTITGLGMAAGDRLVQVYQNSVMRINGTVNAPNAHIRIEQNASITNSGTVSIQYIRTDAATAVWTQDTNSNLTLSGTVPARDWDGVLNASAAGNTVNYNGAAQTVISPSGASYANLTLSGSGAKTMPTGLTVAENFTMSGTASVAAPAALTVGGDFTIGAGNTFAPGTGTVTLNGAAAQTISGNSPRNFNKLAVTNAANPNITLATNVVVNSTLTGTVRLTNTCPIDYTLTSTIPAQTLHSCPPQPPTVTSIAPASGPAAGGTAVTITGTNFTGATAVTIGGTSATSIVVSNATTITAVTPAGTAGARNVVVTTPYGTGTGVGLFTYLAAAPIAEYRMDEVSAGTVIDSSGNGLSGTLNGGVTVGGAGKVCRGYNFNGSNAFVSVPTTALLNQGNITVMAWMRHSTASIKSWEAIVTKGDSAYRLHLYGGGACSINGVNTTGGLSLGINGGCAGADINSGTVPVAGTWYHAAGTYDGSTIKIYVNGTLSASWPFSGAINSNSFPLYIGANAEQAGRLFSGDIDEVKIYSSALTAPQISAGYANENAGNNWDGSARVCAAAGPDHLRIVHDGQGSSCQTETVTVVACSGVDAGAPAACTPYTGGLTGNLLVKAASNATLATLPFTMAAGSSSVTLTVPAQSAQGVIFETSGLSMPPINGFTCWNTSLATASCSMVISACPSGGFNCLDSTITSYSNDGSARLYTKLAATPFNFDVVALNAGGTTETSYVVSGGTPKSVTVELVEGAGSTACISRAAIGPAVSQAISFASTDSGRKTVANMTVSKTYPDLRCRVTDSNQSPSVVSCSTDNFAVRPGAVTLSTVPVMATPPSASSANVIKAGALFTLRAATSTSATDGYSGNLTQDTAQLSAQIPSQDTSPAPGGVVGTLAPATLAANAAPSDNASYSEVGYLYLKPGALRDAGFTAVDQPGDCVAGSTSVTLSDGKFGYHIGNTSEVSFGRFIPDRFEVSVASNGVMQTACGSSFTYTGQPMRYNSASLPSLTIKPMSAGAGGTVTQNYQGAFQKLASSGVLMTSPTADTTQFGKDGVSKTALTGAMSAGTFGNTDGTMTYTLNAGDQFTYTRNANSLIGPYSTALPLSVTAVAEPAIDAVTATGTLPTLQPTGVFMRYGRARMFNAYGSELLDLPIVFRTEFLASAATSNVWSLNNADSCTNATVSFTPVGTTNITSNTCVLEPGNNSGKGCATALTASQTNRRYLETGVTGTDSSGVAGFAGNFNLWLRAPGAANVGSIDIRATVDSWLQYPWVGAIATDPSARATFGIFKSPLIYRRENY